MKSLIVTFTLLVALMSEVNCLQCYVCNSTSLPAPTAGCHDEATLDPEFLTECADDEENCSVLKVTGKFLGIEVISYQRACQKYSVDQCMDLPEGMKGCFHGCQTDGCNDISTLPSEGDTDNSTTAAPPTTTPLFEVETTQEATEGPETTVFDESTAAQESTAFPESTVPDESTEAPEPEATTQVEETTEDEATTPGGVESTTAMVPEEMGLFCFTCSFTGGLAHPCTDGGLLNPSYLVECQKGERCFISKMYFQDSILSFKRGCTSEVAAAPLADCLTGDLGHTECTYACDTDHCNDLNSLPGEPTYAPDSTTVSETTEEATTDMSTAEMTTESSESTTVSVSTTPELEVTEKPEEPPLLCYNCSYISMEEDSKECYEDVSSSPVAKCAPTEYCGVVKIKEEDILIIQRTCMEVEIGGCEKEGMYASCTYTCQEDYCNDMNTLPGEGDTFGPTTTVTTRTTTTAPPTTPPTTFSTTSRDITTSQGTSSKAQVTTEKSEEGDSEKTTATTGRNVTAVTDVTTSGSQRHRVSATTVLGFFASFLLFAIAH